MHYRVIGLNESSTEYDTKTKNHKLALQFQPDKNNHSQASAVMLMINETKEGLEEILCYNDVI